MQLRIAVPDSFLAENLQHPFAETIVWQIDDPGPVPDVEILVTGKPDFDRSKCRLKEIPALRLIQLMSLGYDWIEGFRPDRVAVASARGCLEPFAAEHAVGLLIAGLRRMDLDYANHSHRLWSPRSTKSIQGSTVLLLGYGGLGKTIERMLQPFQPGRIIRVAKSARVLEDGKRVHSTSDLTELAAEADALICTLPDMPSTRSLVNSHVLNALPEGAVVVNVGRGTVIDTDALQECLQRRHIVAMLDVVETEPLPQSSHLWSVPNLVITPHVGGEVVQTQEAMLGLIRRQIDAIQAEDQAENIV